MKKIMPIIIIAGLVTSLFGLSYYYIKQQKYRRANENLSEYIRKYNDAFASFSSTLATLIIQDGLDIPNVALRNSDGNYKMLLDIIENEKMLVYLPEMSCSVCANQELELVNSTFGEYTKNILIVSNFESVRKQKVFERESNIKTYSLKKNEVFLPKNTTQNTVIFLISKELTGHCFLLLDSENSKVTEIYYKAIVERLNKNLTD
jgi:peroxiredoxin